MGLSAGTYSACIQIPEKSDYEQCFTLVVREPQELEVSVALSEQNSKDELNASKKVSLHLTGGKVYFVKLNDKTIITQEDSVELELEPGINKLEVNTDNLCQGTYSEIINLAGLPNLSPNPIRENQILVKLNDYFTDDIEVKIFELNGRLLLSKSFEIRGGELRIDAGALPKGIFLLQLNSGPRVYNLKFLK
ncbi:T9SS type A sorting domain-containing protein [Robiginitalea sp.]|nr:T9SS type A sorting domain-containing protein [Robiginitalea sp.]